jgi:hypothetical protein
MAKSKFVAEYVRTINSTKYLPFDFPTKVKWVVRICENCFCIYTFRICVKYVSHAIVLTVLIFLILTWTYARNNNFIYMEPASHPFLSPI